MDINIKFGGIGVLITLVFLVLKLTGIVSWPWIVVFLPVIIGVVLTILLVVAGLLLFRRK